MKRLVTRLLASLARARGSAGDGRGPNPRDSWPAWTDTPVSLGPAAEPVARRTWPTHVGRLHDVARRDDADGSRYLEAVVDMLEPDPSGDLHHTGLMRGFPLHAISVPDVLLGTVVHLRPLGDRYLLDPSDVA